MHGEHLFLNFILYTVHWHRTHQSRCQYLSWVGPPKWSHSFSWPTEIPNVYCPNLCVLAGKLLCKPSYVCSHARVLSTQLGLLTYWAIRRFKEEVRPNSSLYRWEYQGSGKFANWSRVIYWLANDIRTKFSSIPSQCFFLPYSHHKLF